MALPDWQAPPHLPSEYESTRPAHVPTEHFIVPASPSCPVLSATPRSAVARADKAVCQRETQPVCSRVQPAAQQLVPARAHNNKATRIGGGNLFRSNPFMPDETPRRAHHLV